MQSYDRILYVIYTLQGPGDELAVQYQRLDLTNVSSLPLSCTLSLSYPFLISVEEGAPPTDSQALCLGIGQTHTVCIQFNPAYQDDTHIRIKEDVLSITYDEHPHVVRMYGEGRMPEWLRYWTLNHEIVGSSPAIHKVFCA